MQATARKTKLDGSQVRLLAVNLMFLLRDKFCCCIVRVWLVPRAEGAARPVPARLWSLINTHLETCSLCRTELKNLRFTTFTLRKAGRTSSFKSGDSTFAERVIDRVRRGEEVRSRRRAQVRLTIASASGIAAFTVMLGALGGFNELKAAWARQYQPKPASIAPAVYTSPFAQHDPFGAADSQALNTNVASELVKQRPSLSRQHPSMFEKAVPDLLSHLHSFDQDNSKLIAEQPSPIANQGSFAPPTLAPSTFQLQVDKQPSKMTGTVAPSAGLPIVAAPPSAPVEVSISAVPIAATATASGTLSSTPPGGTALSTQSTDTDTFSEYTPRYPNAVTSK